MITMGEIVDLSGKELELLVAYQNAVVDKNTDLEHLAKEVADLTSQRKTAYAHFQDLAEIKN